MEQLVGGRIFVAVDPSKDVAPPLVLGGKLSRRLRLPIALVTVFHRPRLSGPEDEAEQATRDRARQDLVELGNGLEGARVEGALALASGSPSRALHQLSDRANSAVIVVAPQPEIGRLGTQPARDAAHVLGALTGGFSQLL
jgi:hypothetical protein